MSASTSELKLKPCRSPYCECEPGKCTRPGFRDARHKTAEIADEEDRLRALFEATAKDSFNFRRSRHGTYVNPAVARDWKWFYLGATKGNKSHSLRPAEIDRIVYEHTKLNPNQADDQTLLAGIRSAVSAILALCEQSYPLPDDLYDSKDWRQGNYASRVEWLHTMYEHVKHERDEYAAQLEALRPQAVPTLDLEAACIGYARLDGNEYKLASMRHNSVMDDGQLHPIYTFSDEVAEAHHGITAQGAQAGGGVT